MTSSKTKQDANLSGTVLKALDILDLVANAGKPLTAPEIAKRSGMSRPTVYRLLSTLESRGYLANNEHEYLLGSKILNLSAILLDTMDLPTLAHPYLRHLCEASGETTYISILDGTHILYVNKVESSQSIRSNCTIGTRNPLHCSSMGKAILAQLEVDELNDLLNRIELIPRTSNTITDCDALLKELEKVKSWGYSIDDEEIEDNVRCVGAPIFNHKGYPFAAMSLSGPKSRLSMDRLHELSILVVEATQIMSRQLGYSK